MIEVRNLVKTFGVIPVLRGLDFQVERGEFVALLGPNGAGKTTFLRILATLSRASMGAVSVAGYSLPKQAHEVRRKLGVLSHQPLLYGDLSAEENLRFYGRIYALQEIEQKIDGVLDLVGLSHRRRDLVRQFSRGMQQRLAIGRAILHHPNILLFDEPHTGLDQEAAEMLDTLLGQIASEGRTVVMTSHDITRAAKLASRVDILSKGRISRSLPVAEIDLADLPAIYKESTYA